MFGQLLLMGTKAMLLTDNHGLDALDELVDKAIAAENKAGIGKFWERLDVFTGEGFFNTVLFKGKYMAHNVSSSAARGTGVCGGAACRAGAPLPAPRGRNGCRRRGFAVRRF